MSMMVSGLGGISSILRNVHPFVNCADLSSLIHTCTLLRIICYQQHARQTTTTNSTASACTPTLSSTGDAKTFLKEIGLRAVLEDGVARLLKVFPRPSSQREAWRVLSAQITRNFEQQDGGDSKYDAAVESMLSVIVETLVRSLSRVAV